MRLNKLGSRIFDAAWVIFLVAQLAAHTAWYALWDAPVKVVIYKAASLVSCFLCVCVIVIGFIRRSYSKKVIAVLFLWAVITALSWYFSRNNMLIWTFLILAGACGQDSRRLLRVSAALTAAALLVTVTLSMIMPAYDFTFEDAGGVRHYLGFNWAANAPTLLFFLSLQYIFLRKQKMRFWEYIILEAANVFLFIMTDTNMPFILMTLVLIAFMIEGFFKNHWKILSRPEIIYYIIPAAICIITVIMYICFNPEIGFWEKLNRMLNHRFGFGRLAFDNFGVKPFGQEIFWAGNTIGETAPKAYNYVDSSYMQILFNYGPFYLASVIGIYTWLHAKAVKARDYWLVWISIAVLLHSFTEPRLFDISYNVIPVLAFCRLERVEDGVSLRSLSSTNLRLKFIFRAALYRLKSMLGGSKRVNEAFARKEPEDVSDIPVFVISYNRISYLERMIASLERKGIKNIHIIDNASTYPPLLDYYDTCPYDVIRMSENLGSRVFWRSDVFDSYRDDFYVVTDSDLELIDECPGDILQRLFNTLKKYPFVRKAGLSLKIDDLPDNEMNRDVILWEKQFFKAPIDKHRAYYASVDTTFALYLPDHLAGDIPFLRAIRCAQPYIARHLPWYRSADELTDEDRYYSGHRSNGWWDAAYGEVTPD